MGEKLGLIVRFLKIDWNVQHAHRPSEIAAICGIASQKGYGTGDEVFVEAGCWLGGSSAKFSFLCAKFGYQLHIFDSFEGVEAMTPDQLEESYDYSGQYIGPLDVVKRNLTLFGKPELCHFHKGWFSDTLAHTPISHPVGLAYIDCDLAKGTEEVLTGIMPNLVPGGVIFSQDYHIKPVRTLLHDHETWKRLGRDAPTIKHECYNLASIHFEKTG